MYDKHSVTDKCFIEAFYSREHVLLRHSIAKQTLLVTKRQFIVHLFDISGVFSQAQKVGVYIKIINPS